MTAGKLFPDRRKIIWFMQPHHPFLNKSFEDIGFKPDLSGDNEEKIWDQAEKGFYEKSDIWAAYRENLEYVLPIVQELINSLNGETVVTSDHGNVIGERGLYGHPSGKNAKVLRKVPWDVRED